MIIYFHVGAYLQDHLNHVFPDEIMYLMITSEMCARGRPALHLAIARETFCVQPPGDADFLAEVTEKFDDGQPWHNVIDEISYVQYLL